MGYTPLFEISAAGMALERARVEVATLNLANLHTTAAPGQPAYQPLHVLANAASAATFASLVDGEVAGFAPAHRIAASPVEPRRVHEPGHPHADAAGYVSYPGVDTAREMLTMMSASRAYEANVAAMNATRAMLLKALEIGGAS